MRTGQRRHVVTLENPGDPIPDGDGGYTEAWAPLDPAQWDCAIEGVSVRPLSQESRAGNTVLAQASHVVTGPYHAGITIETRINFRGRVFHVVYVGNTDERDIQTELLCREVLT
jgi:head-tail adaptor